MSSTSNIDAVLNSVDCFVTHNHMVFSINRSSRAEHHGTNHAPVPVKTKVFTTRAIVGVVSKGNTTLLQKFKQGNSATFNTCFAWHSQCEASNKSSYQFFNHFS